VKAKEYDVLRMAVKDGVAHGWRRAYKHADVEPCAEEADRVKDAIEDEVTNAICEWFDFDTPEAEG
jgi:hypothetical protein